VEVPHAGRIKLGLGVKDEGAPVTFRIEGSTKDETDTVLLEETYANPDEWAERVVDLRTFAGKDMTLALEVDSDQPGSVAFWATPTISGISDEFKPKTYPGQQEEPIDLDVTNRIIEEAYSHSQVLGLVSTLTDVHGPRLSGSSKFFDAGEWALTTLDEWGIQNARMEHRIPADPGWENERFYAHVTSPVSYPLAGYPLALTPSTDGWVSGEAVIVRIENEEDLQRYRGKLRGKFVLTDPPPNTPEPSFERAHTGSWSDEELKRTSEDGLLPWDHWPEEWEGPDYYDAVLPIREFLLDEGVAAWIGYGRGEGGTVFVQGTYPQNPDYPPLVHLIYEHYGRIWRNLESGIPVELEMKIQNRFFEDESNSFNVLAEIQGTDKGDELVIFGGHLDSWHMATGATDNASGVAVAMEAIRILKGLGLPMRRTVQIALWGGHELGALGSKAYVERHITSGQAKVSGYFNLDHGAGRIRGIELMGNNGVAPVFARWMEPFHYLGMTTLSPGGGRGSDHWQFFRAGIPSFFFIQDPLYSWVHHSNMDTFDRIVEENLQQSAAVLASFVYHAANREEMLPRIEEPVGGL